MIDDWLNSCYEQNLVSVIIPCHNQERFLLSCLDSVIDQDYRPIEVIIVDDGSSDGTRRIMNDFRSAQRNGIVVKCIYQSQHGAPHARNQGCRQAKGEFIQFLDGDDILCSGKLSGQIDVFKNNKDIDVVYGDGQFLIHDCENLVRKDSIISIGVSSDIIESLLTGEWVPVFSYLSRRSAIISCGPWNNTLKINQDFEYFLRMAIQRCKFYYRAGITGLYRKHSSNSISEQTVSILGRTTRIILCRAEYSLKEQGGFTEQRISAMVEYYRRIARQVYPMDIECFENSINDVLRLCPQYLPKSNRARIISKIIGFRNYEKIAARISHFTCKVS